MLIAAVHNPDAACCNIFNCVSNRAVTLDGMAKLCAAAAGKTAEIIHYDPKAIGIDAKKAFPFRNMVNHITKSNQSSSTSFIEFYNTNQYDHKNTQHFYAEPRAAKEILGWESTTNLPEDLKERFEEYVKIGRDKKEVKFELDDKILEAVKKPVPA